ncbi:MAG: hypothetical protein MGF17_08875 [Trichodesmium sp. MAG_R04]|jgi:hypothetical protein|nr:hypothetical protein [Trichodesmium sp. MAG_R04]
MKKIIFLHLIVLLVAVTTLVLLSFFFSKNENTKFDNKNEVTNSIKQDTYNLSDNLISTITTIFVLVSLSCIGFTVKENQKNKKQSDDIKKEEKPTHFSILSKGRLNKERISFLKKGKDITLSATNFKYSLIDFVYRNEFSIKIINNDVFYWWDHRDWDEREKHERKQQYFDDIISNATDNEKYPDRHLKLERLLLINQCEIRTQSLRKHLLKILSKIAQEENVYRNDQICTNVYFIFEEDGRLISNTIKNLIGSAETVKVLVNCGKDSKLLPTPLVMTKMVENKNDSMHYEWCKFSASEEYYNKYLSDFDYIVKKHSFNIRESIDLLKEMINKNRIIQNIKENV